MSRRGSKLFVIQKHIGTYENVTVSTQPESALTGRTIEDVAAEPH